MSTTRAMTKSPVRLAERALAVARGALPEHSSRYSRKDYTQHQLFALLALREFLKTDYRGVEQYLRDWSDLRHALGLSKVPDHTTLQKAARRLLEKRGRRPPHGGRRGRPRPDPAQAPGGDRRHRVRGPPRQPVLRPPGREAAPPSVVAEADGRPGHGPHLFLSAHVTRGPSQDSPQLKPAARAAVARCPLDTLLGDTAYDAEHNHALCRDRLGIRSTVFPLNRRNGRRKRPKTKYRRQMVRRFRKKPRRRRRRVYGQRWQIESGFSRHKRLLGSALRARAWPSQKKEIYLRVVTHNLMLLAAG
jgi:hypothetical protein